MPSVRITRLTLGYPGGLCSLPGSPRPVAASGRAGRRSVLAGYGGGQRAADVLARAGDERAAANMLTAAVSDAETLRLPHQIQRIVRLTARPNVLTGHPIQGPGASRTHPPPRAACRNGFHERHTNSATVGRVRTIKILLLGAFARNARLTRRPRGR
jgi:hypothetical protein